METDCRDRRQDSARGKAWRHPGRTADQIRSCPQSHDREGSGPNNSVHADRPRRRGDRMRRREFVTYVGGAVAWPLVARAQQPTIPVIGLLGSATANEWTPYVRAFHQGLRDAGYVEGENVAIEARWANSQYE